ncbi:lipolytic enzyme [Mycena latifolia]|nr:lipolytic enzyme [Mycena latifolia]
MFITHRLLALALALAPSAYAGFSGKTTRIMPLGASITFGVGSTDGNGYRADLYNLLAADGNIVDMVGSQKGGDFFDPYNEGYPGFIITQVNNKSNAAMPVYRPNVVTLLVGTNDMLQNIDPAGAPARLSTLIQDVLDAPPLTLVVLATIPPNADVDANTRIDTYNAALPGVVAHFVHAGRSVVLADCHAVVALGDLVDGTHPNDAAYARMAKVFYDAMQVAFAKGWIFNVEY